MKLSIYAASTVLAVASTLVCTATAQAQSQIRLDLPPQSLGTTLRAIAKAAGRQIIIDADAIEGRMAPAITGEFTVEQAVRKALQGSGLRDQYTGDAILVGAALPASTSSNDIMVTGSRIKGAPLASPVITVGRQDIRDGGFADLGEAMRALPQNFGGGQNPGIGYGASAGGITNQNATGGSAVNLRGLGQDATLTLLNGARMTYGGFAQGIDISAIPIDAIERVDVVPDGASAIYGSDAVAGVVNVVLRPSYEGLEVFSRIGTATRGGMFSQQYGALGGVEWAGGSLYASYSYRANEAIQARQRSFTEDMGDPYELYPDQRSHSALLHVTQNIGSSVKFSADGLFNHRTYTPQVSMYGVLLSNDNSDRLVSVAPTLDVSLSQRWSLSLRGVYSNDRLITRSTQSIGGVSIYNSHGRYCNSLYGTEAFIEGGAFDLPGGVAKVVAGGGYRSNRFENRNLRTGTGYAGKQEDTYAYAELFVPIVSHQNNAPWIEALSFTLAGRYDRYNRFGSITTPKLGVVYAPLPDLDLKFSWGRSFKAPTLIQQLSARSATLVDARTLVGSTDPLGTTALYTEGGAPGLKPERATSLSWTASIHPVSAPGLTLDVTYFRVRYRDRVLSPIGNYLDSLTPANAEFVLRDPTIEQVQQAIASADNGLQYYGNVSRNLADVAYIIDNHYTNVARQTIQGIDATLGYRTTLGRGDVSTSLNASWLDSRQRNSASSAYFDRAGTIWNPPHLKARAGLGWEGGGLRAFGFLNYTGVLKDTRASTTRTVQSTITMDTTLSYAFGEVNGALGGTELSLSVENLFDTKPPYLVAAAYVEPYDGTNYSPIGRFVALSISKTF